MFDLQNEMLNAFLFLQQIYWNCDRKGSYLKIQEREV